MESSEWNCGDSVKKCGIGLAVMWKGEEGRANCDRFLGPPGVTRRMLLPWRAGR